MAVKQILIRNDLNVLGQLAVKQLREELIFQQHVASAKLYDSANYKIESINNGLRTGVYVEDYGIFVDSGRLAGGKRVPIDALIQWVKVKGFTNDDKQARSIAFAVQTKIFKEGIPTTGSKRLAVRRKNFIKIVKANIEKQAGQMILEKCQDSARSQLNEWFRKANQELRNG